MEDLFYIYGMSLLTFALYGWDKHLAVYGKVRIPEVMLLFFAAIGGAFGALCGMLLFRHKTLHRKFQICVPVFAVVQIALDAVCRLWLF